MAPVLWSPGEGGYDAVHHRLRVHRGPAREHVCVDCGRQAREWSYDHKDPDELLHGNVRDSQWRNGPSWYSRKLEHYEPRCAGCHRQFDRSRT